MRKGLVIGVALLLAVSLLVSGCGNGSQSAANATSGQQQSTLEKVLKTKELTAAVILSFPPFGFKDEKGQPQGYDVDMAKALADSLGAKLNIIEVTAANRIPYLETGKADVVFGNFTRTLERAQKIDFSDPYVVAGETLLVKKGSGIKGVNDLKGKTVAVVKGSTNGDIVKKHVPDANVRYFDTSADCVMAVKNGQADAFVEDSNFIAYQAKINPDLEEVGDSLVALEYNAIGCRKYDQEWLNYLNLFVFDMNKSGKNQELYKKWFGKELPYHLNPQF